ncbi:MAG: AMP-binding protein, partial [Caulobacteraceae bacterium]
MGFFARMVRDGLFLFRLSRTLLRIASIRARSSNLAVDDLERACTRFSSRSAIRFEGAELTYFALNALAGRVAAWAAHAGLQRGEAVAVLLPNRLDYIPLWFGLSKLGVVSALINNELSGPALAHCLAISDARLAIVDETTEAALVAAASLAGLSLEVWALGSSMAGSRDLAAALAVAPQGQTPRRPRAGMKAADTALLIYTSGTTGLPKAARIAHMRAQLFMRGFLGATGAKPSDRIHVALPLYHATGGLCAVGAALLGGGCVILERSFSAHRFFEEIARERATMFVYVGELCRYLAALPEQTGERSHALRLAFGNGLSPDVWRTLQDRFAIPEVLEFYGSTEGNVSMFNFDGKIGAVGRAPRWLAPFFNFALVRFDPEAEAPARGRDGRCERARPGEIGELIGRIGTSSREAFHGYAGTTQTRRKVLTDVFASGDAWFS